MLKPGYHWSTKPLLGSQVNHSHPLAEGLIGCWLFNESGGGTVMDLSKLGQTGTLSTGVTWGGGGINISGGGGSQFISGSWLSSLANGVSFTIQCAPTSTASNLLNYTVGLGNGSTVRLSLFLGGTLSQSQDVPGSIGWFDGTNISATAGGVWNNTTTTDASGKQKDNIVTATYNGAGKSAFYLGGAPLALNATQQLTGALSSANTFHFGCRADLNNNIFLGRISLIYAHSRALTPAEAEWLAAEPYAFIAPPAVRRVFVGVATTHFTLPASSGTFMISGTAATLRHNYHLNAAPAPFSLSGNPATLRHSYHLSAAPGTFTLTGSAATLKTAHKLSASPASFQITGSAATLATHHKLSAGSGSFLINGVAATFSLVHPGSFTLDALPGSFSLTGPAATLKLAQHLSAGPGAFAIAGTAAHLALSRVLPASPGVFSLTGDPATLRVHHTLVAAAGSLSLVGLPATLLAQHRLAALPAAFQITGVSATLRTGLASLLASPGSLTLVGSPASFVWTTAAVASPAFIFVEPFRSTTFLA